MFLLARFCTLELKASSLIEARRIASWSFLREDLRARRSLFRRASFLPSESSESKSLLELSEGEEDGDDEGGVGGDLPRRVLLLFPAVPLLGRLVCCLLFLALLESSSESDLSPALRVGFLLLGSIRLLGVLSDPSDDSLPPWSLALSARCPFPRRGELSSPAPFLPLLVWSPVSPVSPVLVLAAGSWSWS